MTSMGMPEVIREGPGVHAHDELPADHPYLIGDARAEEHVHAFVIDDPHARLTAR